MDATPTPEEPHDPSAGGEPWERGEDDWKPTPHGRLLSRALDEQDLVTGKDVLELGGGVGNHTVRIIDGGARRIVTTEISARRSETTRRNVERMRPDATHVEYRVADWLHTQGTFDVVLTNPPFVVSGKQNRRYFIDALILDAHKRLGPGGELVFVQSSMANLPKTLARLDENGFEAEVLLESQHPFRDYYLEDAAFLEEIEAFPGAYHRREGERWETLHVVRGTLRPFTPSAGAH